MAPIFKVILPKKFNEKEVLESFRVAIEDTIEEADKEFFRTYATFRHQPTFEQDFDESSSKIEGVTETSGDGDRDNPYPFVERGTSVRFATMTSDFVAKTKPGVLSAGSGRGDVLYIDKRRPRPGIKARNKEKIIVKTMKSRFPKIVNINLAIGVKKSGHEI